jgi:hypothetical protein
MYRNLISSSVNPATFTADMKDRLYYDDGVPCKSLADFESLVDDLMEMSTKTWKSGFKDHQKYLMRQHCMLII